VTDDIRQTFDDECRASAAAMAADPPVIEATRAWLDATLPHRYSYNFRWMGRPIIQYPADVLAIEEAVWSVKPDLIVECGVAHGGLTVFLSSLLRLIGGTGRVLGVDVEIRPHNRTAIEEHPMADRIDLLEASSVLDGTAAQVAARASEADSVMVILDSNHTHDHVLAELRHYAPLVTPGSYIMVLDTVVEDLPAEAFPDRPWGPGDNPKTAVWAYLAEDDRFRVDVDLENKLLLSSAPQGYLRRER
jgi:cephalosporin hydroxylase